MAQQVQQRPTTAFALSIAGSILMLISAIVELAVVPLIFRAYAFHRLGYMPMMGYPFIFAMGPMILALGIIGLVVSIVALYFSIRLNGLSDVNAVHSTGIILLILSIIGLFVANGFIIGFILLLVGSILALTWKP